MANYLILPGTVQETMFITLWARVTYSQLYPDLLNDLKAAEIVEKIDYDFSKVRKSVSEYLALAFLVRARTFDDALKIYIEKNPNTTVVNLGSGLDTTFSRVDNGKIKWYDLDLPDAVEVRKQFIPESSRSKCISKSVLDYSWFDDVEFKPKKGIFFLAGGLFMYFKEKEVSELFRTMAERFPGGEMIFDSGSKLGGKIANIGAKLRNIKSPSWQFGLGNPEKQISKWSDKIQVVDCFTFWAQTPRNPKWDKKTRRLINLAEFLKLGKFVQVRFLN